jgi:hypothetical protein
MNIEVEFGNMPQATDFGDVQPGLWFVDSQGNVYIRGAFPHATLLTGPSGFGENPLCSFESDTKVQYVRSVGGKLTLECYDRVENNERGSR